MADKIKQCENFRSSQNNNSASISILTDNGNGSYTHDDGTGNTQTIQPVGYQMAEHLTGEKWINNKPIYRQGFLLNNVIGLLEFQLSGNLSPNTIDHIIGGAELLAIENANPDMVHADYAIIILNRATNVLRFPFGSFIFNDPINQTMAFLRYTKQ